MWLFGSIASLIIQQKVTDPTSGYQAMNQVTVTVDDLSRLGNVSDTLVRSGANQVGGISFTIADPKPLADRARTAAVNDAMAKARTLAMAAVRYWTG